MAFPTVTDGASFISSGTSTSHSVTLPGTINSGGWLLMKCFTSVSAASNSNSISTTGWVKLKERSDVDGSIVLTLTIFGKRASGSEGSTVSVASSGGASRMVCYTYSGDDWEEDTNVTGSIEVGTIAYGDGNAEADAPSLTASWGTADNLWIAGGGAARLFGTAWWSTAPSNYTNLVSVNQSASSVRTSVGTARRERNAATEDPGAFTMSNSTCSTWTCAIVIKPAGVVPPSGNPWYHYRQMGVN